MENLYQELKEFHNRLLFFHNRSEFDKWMKKLSVFLIGYYDDGYYKLKSSNGIFFKLKKKPILLHTI